MKYGARFAQTQRISTKKFLFAIGKNFNRENREAFHFNKRPFKKIEVSFRKDGIVSI
jgi:hypothetical protein